MSVRAALTAAFAALAAALGARGAAQSAEYSAILDMLNSRAAGDVVRYEASAETVAKGAKRGDPLMKFLLALCARDAANPPRAARIPPEERDRLFAESKPVLENIAGRSSNPLVLYLLAMEAKDGKLLEKAAELGNPQALNRMAAGIVADNPDTYPACETNAVLARACAMFRHAADMRDMNGLYNYGVCLNSGIGIKRDAEAAFNAFRTAAELGHVDAMNNLGICYREGIHVAPDLKASAYWFRKAAGCGSATGMLNYGWALRKGEGVEKDDRQSALMIYKASRMGHPDAQNAWGMMLLEGVGIEREPEAAVRAFKASAGQGCVQAMRNLQTCYAEGLGVKASASEALLWKMRADAACGDEVAAAWLAAEEGRGGNGGKAADGAKPAPAAKGASK